MKQITLLLLTVFLSLIVSAQNKNDEKKQIYSQILEKGTQSQKDSLVKVIINDSKTLTDESELQLYARYLQYLKLNEEADAVEKRAIKLYPKGAVAREKDIAKYYELESLKEKEKAYNAILKKYPMKNFPNDGIIYDYVTSALAKDFAEDGQKNKALGYLDNMQERFWRAQGYMAVAGALLQQGDTATAVPLVEKSISDALYFIRGETQDNKAKFAGFGYPGYVQTFAGILLAQGKYQEALTYIEEAMKIVPERTDDFRSGYAKALEMTGRDLEAYNQYRSLFADGQFGYLEPLEKLYIKLNKGQRTGFDAFIENQKSILKKNIQSHLSTIITSKETPSFKLRNLKGEIVDSKSLLGKVLVLDFWATWCKPCINSFPGMQKAVTKYQNDPDVVFLFIDTWERDDNYEQKVRDFISKNHYTFNVLFDDKKNDEEIAPKFGIQGIPAKFIIDKKGKTRFFLTGSSPYPDYILMEVSEMIEMARKG